jgi:hypothetical protein
METRMTALYDDELKAVMQVEAHQLRQVRRNLLAVLDRCQRVATRRNMTGDEAIVLTRGQVSDYFAAEIAARKVGG